MRFRVVPGIVITWCGTQMVLADHVHHVCYRLNGFATRIWALLVKGTSQRTIVARLRQELGAPADWLEGEALQVAERLLAAGIIERRTT